MTGVWVSIDGVEGAGKSTLAEELGRQADVVGVHEFSDSPMGQVLREAVTRSPHHIMDSALAQSLYFLGEFRERWESTIVPGREADRVVVHDRGYLSKYVYQRVVMEPTLGAAAHEILAGLFRHFPPPDLTVVLDAPGHVIRERLVGRDGSCDTERTGFIERARPLFLDPPVDIGPTITFDTTTLPPSDIAAQVLAAVERLELERPRDAPSRR